MNKILIVDDEIVIATDIALRMKSLGYEDIIIADSASEAKDALLSQTIDLVLIDLSLYNTNDGIILAKYIHELQTKIPFIYIIEKSTADFDQKIRELNADAILLKPFVDYGLSEAIKEVLLKNEDARITHP